MTLHPLPPALRTRSDEELVRLHRQGRATAADAVVERYAPALTAFARGLLGGAHHDAEEVVQDTFVRALAALRRDPGREVVLKPWLYAIARNACVDRLRRSRPVVALDALEAVLRDPDGDPHACLVGREALEELVADLGTLPERQRRAIVLHELEGRSHAAIGAELGVTAGGSKALVHRARGGLSALRAAA